MPDCTKSMPRYANGRLVFDIVLEPEQSWHGCVNVTALADGDVLRPQPTCAVPHVTEAAQGRDDFIKEATQLRTSNADIVAYYQHPDANIPQAWVAGSIFLLSRTLLGLEADAPKKQLTVQPFSLTWNCLI